MDLIVTHTNADFDGLASLVAARKLYPGAQILLPGSQEKQVRDFLALCKDLIDARTEKEIDFGDVERLILVDTRHRTRLGKAEALIGEAGHTVHIYDHHPRTKSDIKADKDIYEEVGATVTILVDLIKRQKVELTRLEATLLALGIYEETGSLTFRTTTNKDLDAVGFLLSSGANLGVISSYLNRELSDKELRFLAILINSTKTYNVNGINVTFTSTSTGEYIGELGTLVHRLVDLEHAAASFVLIKLDKKVVVIARSRTPYVDVNKIMRRFGGAGHTFAASAQVKGVELEKVEGKVLKILEKMIKVDICAKDIMISPVEPMRSARKVVDGQKILQEAGLAELPVSERGKIIGMISIRNLEKAARHGGGYGKVKGHMSSKLVFIKPSTPLPEMQRLMEDKKTGSLLVVKGKRLVGLVARPQVARALYGDVFKQEPAIYHYEVPETPHILNVAERMSSMLPGPLMKTLRWIGSSAQERKTRAFVVGGFVRDLLLGVKNYDLDIVVEGDAIDFGNFLAKQVKRTLVVHKKFGTATVVMDWPAGLVPIVQKDFSNKFKIDVATARTEIYKHPAALPTVTFGSIRDDIIRRDFTINAMAVSINKDSFGQLIDFFGGQRDLLNGKIRVLHDKSFIDDPTRIFRAVRFEQRFNFKIEPHTEELIKNAITMKMIDRTTKQRIRDELVLILKEEEPLKGLLRMHELHELRFIHPELRFTKEMAGLFRKVKRAIVWFNSVPHKRRQLDIWLIYLIIILSELPTRAALSVAEKFAFRRGDRIRILSYKVEAGRALKLLDAKKGVMPSQLYRVLSHLSYEVIILILAEAKSKDARKRIAAFLSKYNNIKTAIRGDDLKGMGVPAGPHFGKILDKVLYAKIDGKVKNKRQELALAGKLAAKLK